MSCPDKSEDVIDRLELRNDGDLNGLLTRTTRYKGEDGQERAVLLWEYYIALLEMLDKELPA